MSFEEKLKSYLPEIHRDSDSMDNFVQAMGQLLDGFSGAIDGFANYYNYEELNEEKIEYLAQQFDIKFLRNISLSRKRQFVSEAIDLYRTNGTEKSLLRVFRLIGWDVIIDYCWTVNPAYYQSNASYTLSNNDSQVNLSVNELVFGTERVTNTGTFVDIVDLGGNRYPGQPIYGEEYSVKPLGERFVKVPYIRINVRSEDYDLFTSDYVDEETGKVYSYTQQESFQILQDIRSYFLEQARPAHVALFEISTPFDLLDVFAWPLTETLQLNTVSVGAQYDGTLVYGGFDIDRYIMNESMGGFEYGNTTMNYYGVSNAAPQQSFAFSYGTGAQGAQNHFLLRNNSEIDITVPSDATVNILVSSVNGKIIAQGQPDWQFLQSLTNVTNQTVTITGYFAAMINITRPSSSAQITGTVRYL